MQQLPPGGGAGPTSPLGQQQTTAAVAAAATAPPAAPTGPEVVPGFRRFAIEHFAGGACVAGLVRGAASGLLDTRDVATVALLGEVGGGWGRDLRKGGKGLGGG